MFVDWIISLVSALVATFGFAIIYNIHKRNVVVASLGGAFGWLFYLISKSVMPSDIMPYFIAGLAVAFYAETAARIFKTPATIYLMPGFIPLVPGLTIFRTMEACLFGNVSVFAQGIVNTLKIGGAISLGMMLVSSFFRLFTNCEKQSKK